MGVRRSMISGCVAVVLALGAAAGLQAQAPRVVAITGTDAMKYSVTAIEAKPGEKLTVKLTGQGAIPKVAMAHNFVLLGGRTGAEVEGHDWEYLLQTLGLLTWDHRLARLAHLGGLLVMAAALVWAALELKRQYQAAHAATGV